MVELLVARLAAMRDTTWATSTVELKAAPRAASMVESLVVTMAGLKVELAESKANWKVESKADLTAAHLEGLKAVRWVSPLADSKAAH